MTTYDKEQIDAIKESIRKWKALKINSTFETGSCSLCKVFDCISCPLGKANVGISSIIGCNKEGHPYYNYRRATRKTRPIYAQQIVSILEDSLSPYKENLLDALINEEKEMHGTDSYGLIIQLIEHAMSLLDEAQEIAEANLGTRSKALASIKRRFGYYALEDLATLFDDELNGVLDA